MDILIEIFAQFDIILVALMFSGLIVRMRKDHSGTTAWDTHYAGFYLLFTLLIAESVIISLLTNYFFLPVFEQVLFSTYSKTFAISADLVLIANLWFSLTFKYKPKKLIIALLVITLIITALLFYYNVTF
ncbi:MAG: hypothetical protein ACE14S_00665 [Candidatus Bathyarchaeia archaeon]